MSRFNLNTHTFSNFYADDGLQGNEFSKNASFADHNGILWFGGTNGITYFNPQEITNPAKKWNVRIIDFYLHDQPIRLSLIHIWVHHWVRTIHRTVRHDSGGWKPIVRDHIPCLLSNHNGASQ